jgi:hypothetical protein
MRFANSTRTELRLANGDVRDVVDRLLVIGRDPALKRHYEERLGRSFTTPAWLRPFRAEFAEAHDRSIAVLRIPFRPRGSSRRRPQEIDRMQAALEHPLALAISRTNATSIALVPLSCRRPDVVAAGMVRTIWDISVAAFLDVPGPLGEAKPGVFAIFAWASLDPFVIELTRGHYPCLKNGWLFNTAVQCDRSKRARYLRRRRFRFHQLDDS